MPDHEAATDRQVSREKSNRWLPNANTSRSPRYAKSWK